MKLITLKMIQKKQKINWNNYNVHSIIKSKVWNNKFQKIKINPKQNKNKYQKFNNSKKIYR